MHAPEVTDYIKDQAAKVDVVAENVEEVNQIKYDEASKFDAAKDKANFRRYEDACDRVKGFYKVSLPKKLPSAFSGPLTPPLSVCRNNTPNRL